MLFGKKKTKTTERVSIEDLMAKDKVLAKLLPRLMRAGVEEAIIKINYGTFRLVLGGSAVIIK